ncbi:bifunctional glutamate--cysteine ligase GshA/glutathione synthetase GshB [Vagococcus vulneris]|uniref:Glutathione biosynthesis bifunctional protein GshAB n=1 Tax=Vagococcus vulneris TaxID=1977869 RepID=A0A429ZXF5_9ENTE|nr:bifunctional glutamate--cysteine ligase GshA/glutathione synthetase GshB [Vagococcus vulneris]RST98544.1 bifunctional glutamate--cysteine ligase/glutathione synthetase [Vagococcus vulneris]
MRDLQEQLIQEKIRPLFKKMRIGLEKESQRVTPDGSLAKTDHPKSLGSRDYHPYIQTDFSETQMELITPVFESSEEVIQFLGALHDVGIRSMVESERLWPLSMPPALPQQDRDIIIAKLASQGDVNYRRYLAKVYGKRKQMVSGIHYNFELPKELIHCLYNQQTEHETFEKFSTQIYLKIARQYLRYRWLLTYLIGASPYAEDMYFIEDAPKQPVRSIRNSQYGYTNRPEIHVSYQSLESYVADIEKLVDHGELIEAKEFYSPVRLRGSEPLGKMLETGIRYIELRNIDLDPWAEYGITTWTMDFIHLFVMLMLWLPEDSVSDEMVDLGTEYNDMVSLEHPLEQTRFLDEGEWLLSQMADMAEKLQMPNESIDMIAAAAEQLAKPELTLAGRMVAYLDECHLSQHDFATTLAEDFYQEATRRPYQLAGYRHMELSTQIMIFDVLQKGIKLEVLDEQDQFLKLSFKGHVEYVKNGNMTSKDSYVVPLMMENKVVTKKILNQAGYRVPQGQNFSSFEKAAEAYEQFIDKAVVVKPKSTNFGLGISIFKEGMSQERYYQALELAFAEDSDVLVEEFIEGTEYRFFVVDGQTLAVLLRVPANVVGDGRQTIRELVELKNQDPLRGENHRSPLEKIMLGDLEELALKEQGLTFDSVPRMAEVIYLRDNSNVSTGGDSIDVTNQVDDSYKRMAEAAVTTLGAIVSGIDVIIPDITKPLDNVKDYGIIEANFNPMMHMHIYPYAGESRRLTQSILKLLFPELP